MPLAVVGRQKDLAARPPVVVARARRVESQDVGAGAHQPGGVRELREVRVENRADGLAVETFRELETGDEGQLVNHGERG